MTFWHDAWRGCQAVFPPLWTKDAAFIPGLVSSMVEPPCPDSGMCGNHTSDVAKADWNLLQRDPRLFPCSDIPSGLIWANSLHLNVHFEESIFLIKQCLLRLLSIWMSFLWRSLTQNDQIFLKLLGQSGKASCNLTAASVTNSTFYRDLLTALRLCWVDPQVTDACQAPSWVVLAEVWRFLLKKQRILQIFCMFNLQKQL